MGFEVIQGDCLEVMRGMADSSVDAIVTDPPYGLEFMNAEWDKLAGDFNHDARIGKGGRSDGRTVPMMQRPTPRYHAGPSMQTWHEDWAREALRVLKDGGRMLAFGGPRTHHRLTCAVEDAGFLIEDCIMWIFGSGFPKHKSKLKPAYEPIVVARKGGASHLNIDGCRIETHGEPIPLFTTTSDRKFVGRSEGHKVTSAGIRPAALGRWPANVILGCACEEGHEEGCAVRVLDAQSGERKAGGKVKGTEPSRTGQNGIYGTWGRVENSPFDDTGGASRFFYCAKASRAERNAGLEGMPEREGNGNLINSETVKRGHPEKGKPVWSENRSPRLVQNHHPTVKPISLMRYLVRLVTPPGGTVLDPFCGSGSTGVAAMQEGFNFVGIERESEYAEIARRRIDHASAAQPPLFKEAVA